MSPTSIFEPDDANELLRGWLLHAHKGRDRHDLAARWYDRRRYALGIPATVASAIVGTAAFAGLEKSTATSVRIAVAMLAITAAVLSSLQSFLDLGARAERHRLAAVKYKATIRQMEQLGIGGARHLALDEPVVNEIRQRLDALEEEMPVIPPDLYERVEHKYRDTAFVDSISGSTTRSKS
jgi:hypothetical protein